jgi:hypothetical protein
VCEIPLDSDRNPLPGYCVDAPPLSALKPILSQIVTYSVNLGASFLVAGGQSGVLGSGKEVVLPDNVTRVCEPFARGERDPRLISRIPVRTIFDQSGKPLVGLPMCPAEIRNNADDNRSVAETARACDPSRNPTPDPVACWEERFPLDKLAPSFDNNPCVFIGGPAGSDPEPQPTANPPVPAARHLRALFQNNQISFVVANIDRAGPTGAEVHFDVSGGFRPQAVGYPSTVQISMPARIVVGPVDSQPQTESSGFEAPYLFVVDRRRVGGGQAGGSTRGQVVRIHPFEGGAQVGTATGFQPIYEDYNRSGGLFPIQ